MRIDTVPNDVVNVYGMSEPKPTHILMHRNFKLRQKNKICLFDITTIEYAKRPFFTRDERLPIENGIHYANNGTAHPDERFSAFMVAFFEFS